MPKSLVIVESPAKARTIAGYLGGDYAVESSVGHVRDLPDRASDVPAAQRKRFGALGVDVNAGFEPYYVVDPGKKKVVTALKKLLSESDELLLATDEDREGEAIAWHLVEVLKPKVPVRRMVFHEITKDAITRALDETRNIDDRLVDAQETRRILDRLYGYEVSPVLWKKVTRGLSAGRVQSVATRLVVQRERERMAFRSAEYWDLLATFDPGSFESRLVSVDGARVAQGKDFGPTTGELRESGVVHLDEEGARGLAERLEGASFAVRSVDERPYRRKPAAPFRTATLQQEASRKLRFSAQTTMRVAQRLYESGYITYMRTDSTTLSESAIAAARSQVADLFGEDFVPAKPRLYGRAVANAQEAHEAIRPAGDRFRTPDELKSQLGRDELALYDLVWKRTLASQMEDARGSTVSLRIGTTSSSGEDVEFGASGTVITFRGFLAAYEPGKDEPADDDEERVLPPLQVGQDVTLVTLEPDGHTTLPPARTRSPRSSGRWRSGASGGLRRTPRSSRRSSTGATSSRRARHSSRPSSRSPWSTYWSSTSGSWSTSTSPRGWKTTSIGSPPGSERGTSGSGVSTSATAAIPACTTSSPSTSTRSTHARSTPSRFPAPRPWYGSAATGRTSSMASGGRACRRIWPPTS
jgi:DNA topoisomerase-1